MFPVYTSDPLAWARPFPAQPQLYYAAHWHEIVGAAAFYFLIQAVSPFLLARLLGASYTQLTKRTRLNFDIHVVSMVQCVASIALLLPTWNHPEIRNRAVDPVNAVFGYNAYLGFVSAVTTGYFVWDLYVCLRHVKLFGAGFLLHAFVALYVFGCLLQPYLLPWIPSFLLFELSTPFVNFNWFVLHLPKGTVSDRAVAINGVLLLASFFSVRILWGFYAVGLLACDMWRTRGMVSPFFPVSYLVLNVALDVLNLVWFSKMVAIARKKFAAIAKAKEVAKME